MGVYSSFSIRGNIYVELIKKILLSLLVFQLCRIGFFLFNHTYFSELGAQQVGSILKGGLKFDVAAVLYVNSLVILLVILPHPWRFSTVYQQAIKYLFFFCNAVAIAMNVVDFVYYKFTLRRTTADVFAQFEGEQNKLELTFQFLLDYWYAFLVWLFLVGLMIFLYTFIKVTGPMIRNQYVFYAGGLVMMGLFAVLFVAGVRGGFRHSTRPITLSNAGEYVDRAEQISLVLNTPFSIIRTIGKTQLKRKNYFATEEELSAIYSPIHYPKDSAFESKNVVVIILESFSKDFFGTFNKDKEDGTYKGFTPFLDSLIQHSLTYKHSYANGLKSIDGLPAVVSSIPSIGTPYVLTPFAGNEISSLGSLLRKKGYHTSFFHGAPNGSMGFNSFTKMAGFESYYGMSEYNNDDDFDGLWGIWDEPFLQYYATQLNSFPQPFVSAFFSVSSHHPFEIPQRYKARFAGGPQPINRCIEYTDYALKEFFASVSKTPWYQNTLFVITADHTSSNIQFGFHPTILGYYHIPVIFFSPDEKIKGIKPEIIQQIDIMPTVLGYLHFDEPYLAFGRDAWNEDCEPFAFNYRENVYQLVKGKYFLEFDGDKSLGLYDLHEDALLQRNLVAERPAELEHMERWMKALIQQYNNRVIENRMTAGSETSLSK
jgi:phosphoglycerol transferase MdoB-like AlkP superfamily enzyme